MIKLPVQMSRPGLRLGLYYSIPATPCSISCPSRYYGGGECLAFLWFLSLLLLTLESLPAGVPWPDKGGIDQVLAPISLVGVICLQPCGT